ncbi:hypothetical protein ebA541 [Aromatoleum aromaticum EbN1]|uniref:Uncharacterized protein n=1 Tax=Aromatoleum aromaticum (strain DSM 19018 / LMG 30748 / EbN1) TaxID=76114 RepID=Q5P8F9_AROAE|nr:hypothetical protein ebA541 [Aromatoleum aromaticum EbN1]
MTLVNFGHGPAIVIIYTSSIPLRDHRFFPVKPKGVFSRLPAT